MKGLLANIPVVEKVGGKNSTKYVLKADVEFSEKEDARVASVQREVPAPLQPAVIKPYANSLDDGLLGRLGSTCVRVL